MTVIISGTCEMWRLNQMSYLSWIFDSFSHRFGRFVFNFKLPNLSDSDVALTLVNSQIKFDTCQIRCLNWAYVPIKTGVKVQTSQRPRRPKLIPVACHIQILQAGLYTFLLRIIIWELMKDQNIIFLLINLKTFCIDNNC